MLRATFFLASIYLASAYIAKAPQETVSFLETNSGSGDFEFKCETTCQLVQSNAASEASKASSFLQVDSNVDKSVLPLDPNSNAAPPKTQECYSLCLNPKVNGGCDAGAVALLEIQAASSEQLRAQSTADCLNSCVRVCMAVQEEIAKHSLL
eukprot:c45515_g1_i1.p1 GENE.c45515_g1_i1~~c45515_g1_i1.p1  ORF type:complete len:152 (+),score=29.19 c45515_g1_i1:32-487(+)